MSKLVTPHPSENPILKQQDAINRAVRTFAWGLLVDVGAAVVVVLTVAFSSDIQWTREYWIVLAGSLAKTVLVSVTSYFARMLLGKPATA